MATEHWHLRVTIESSAKHAIEQMCERERRSAANFVRILLEEKQRAVEQRSDL